MPLAKDVVETWLCSDQPAVVFDFNGTLSDDEHILFDIFSELFRAHLGWAMTAEDYETRGREVECRALARAVRWHTENRIALNGAKTVVLR